MGIDNKTYAAAKTYTNKVALGFQSVTQTATGFTITFKDGSTVTYNVQNMHEHTNKNILDLLSVDLNGNILYDGKSISPDFIDTAGDGSKFLANDGTYKTVTTGGVAYDDTQVKADIQANTDDIADINNAIGTETMGTTATTITGAVAEINGNQLDTVSFSADYKNIVLNRKNGLNPYSIPIAAIINHAKLIELADVNTTDIGNGKTLVYDTATQKHKYVSYSGTDELVKMDSTTNAHYLADLIDKQTIVNDNGTLKVKKLDGQQVTIAEINYLKGLTMNVMDLVNSFANGGVKVSNTPVATYADLSTLDRSTFIDGISYIVYVLADESHAGAKTTYLCDKTSSTYFGNADSQRNFTTDPIDLANEVTGKLGTSNIDVDSLWALLDIDDTYKTLTTTDNVFGTHGAKAMYDELVAAIGNKANAADLTTHTDDTTSHITQAEKDSYALKSEVLAVDKVQTTTGSETNDTVYSSKLTKDELDKKANDTDVVKKTDISTTIDSTSTDDKVAGAKAVNDKLSQYVHIDGENMLLRCTSSGTVFTDFIDKNCTSNFRAYHVAWNSQVSGTPCPSGYGTIYTYDALRHKKIIAYDVSGNGVWEISKIDGVWGTWQAWQQVRPSVADVPFTKLPLDSKVFTLRDSSSYISYTVRNGMCTITCNAVGLVSTGLHYITTNIPTPVGNYASTILQVSAENTVPTKPVFLYVEDKKVAIYSKNSTGPFWGTLTYPVAE